MAGLSRSGRPARVLALNAGSSSLKAAVRDAADSVPVRSMEVERIGTPDAFVWVDRREDSRPVTGGWDGAVAAVAEAVAELGEAPDAVVHRIVHGGPRHHQPTVVDDALVADLREAAELAPLHMPAALDTLTRARERWAGATHVVCFDTGFHADLPEEARRLPVSETLRAEGVRRYGFHGLSVESVLLARPHLSDLVVAHLGSGCSVTAVGAERTSRWTSMSYSPGSGMISSTRAGDIDPEVLLHLLERRGYAAADLRDEINRRSGLTGLSGGRRDLRDLIGASDEDARLTVEMFVASAAMAIAAASTTLGTWRALVFTGGIGQHSPEVRDRVCARLRLSGVEVEVVRADEERVMDRHARALLEG